MLSNWRVSLLDGSTQYIRAYEPRIDGEFFVFFAGPPHAPQMSKMIRASHVYIVDLFDGPIPTGASPKVSHG